MDQNKKYQIMTKKMQMLYVDIVESLDFLPKEGKGFIFGYDGEVDCVWVQLVASFIILEYIKYSFDHGDPKYSLRHFLKNPDDDSERMLQQRIMKYVKKYKKQEIDFEKDQISSNNRYTDEIMDSIDKRLEGHHITEMNFYENQNIHDLEIVKSIVERRIVSSKKVSNTRFREMFEQYDDLIESLINRSKISDKDMVFASLALFTLEWHYPVEMFYLLCCLMEDEEINTVDRDALILLCGRVVIESRFGGRFTTDSRMIKERLFVLPQLFGKGVDTSDRETMKDLIKEILVLIVKYNQVIEAKDGGLYKEWFRKETSMEDWASFFRYYNVFCIWEKKKWTPKRIQNMRYLFDIVLRK